MCSRSPLLFLALSVGFMACGDSTTQPPAPPASGNSVALDSILTSVRAAHDVPAIAAVVIRAESLEAIGAVGVRRLGGSANVTVDDRFHIGSNTKAMTATMLATLVEDGTLDWGTTPVDAMPEVVATIHPDHVGITLTQLLQHRAGIEPLTSFSEVPPLPGSPTQQRRLGSALLLELPPPVPVGTYLYSNGDYGIAAAMAEARTGKSWEELLQTRLLQPLGIHATVGWPAADDPNQPWGHDDAGSTFVPHEPDLAVDTLRMPPAIAPVGELSLSVRDY